MRYHVEHETSVCICLLIVSLSLIKPISSSNKSEMSTLSKMKKTHEGWKAEQPNTYMGILWRNQFEDTIDVSLWTLIYKLLDKMGNINIPY